MKKKPEEENADEGDEQNMLMAFSAENKQSTEFDWNHHYGRGFNALNFKVLNSVFKEEEKEMK